MPKEHEFNDISQSSEDNNISLLSEDETIWETIEGGKYMHLYQVFFYDPHDENPKVKEHNKKYEHLKLKSGFLVEPDLVNWCNYFNLKKNLLPKKHKIFHYPYELDDFKSEDFKIKQLKVEKELKNAILKNSKSKSKSKIPKDKSYAYNNEKSKKELLDYYKTDMLQIEIRLKENMLNNFPNTCIAIFGEQSTLKEIKLKNAKKVADCAKELRVLSLDNIYKLRSLNLNLKENKYKNQRKYLSTFNCDKIGNHLISSINRIFHENKGDYLLAIIQDKKNKDNIVEEVLDLPGGCRELGETSYDTILRETEEETGIKKEEIEIIGKSDLNQRFRLYMAKYHKLK